MRCKLKEATLRWARGPGRGIRRISVTVEIISTPDDLDAQLGVESAKSDSIRLCASLDEIYAGRGNGHRYTVYCVLEATAATLQAQLLSS